MIITPSSNKPAKQTLTTNKKLLLLLVSNMLTLPALAQQAEISTETLPLLQFEGNTFKDHNKNGVLDAYEDWRLSPQQRAENLVSLMTIEEKAGAMLHGTLAINGFNPLNGSNYDLSGNQEFILNRHINSLITRLGGSPAQIAEDNNRVQVIAESSRLGIPLTISTDPRHHFQYTEGASVANTGFSQWPETLGFADFRPYGPSDNMPASFVAGQNEGVDGAPVGVVVLQIQPDPLNVLMQESTGRGETGATSCVGASPLTRTQSHLA